ncbi:MAG: hypothetical protein L0Y61_08850 [Epsilonproteobacteria bacterium]|nr:hypothetical protein [Campylobacterota bacterium]
MNILFDLNILLDISSEARMEKFTSSRDVFEHCRSSNDTTLYLSSSSLDNFEFILSSELKKMSPDLSYNKCQKIAQNQIRVLLKDFNIAKTPSYIDIDFDDIEDSQIIASAKAIDAIVVTRDMLMVERYPNDVIIFASGVSNSREMDDKSSRKKKLLQKIFYPLKRES